MARGGQARTVQVAVEGRVDHDTNVARTGEAQAALQNIVPEDTVYSPTARFNIVQPIGQQAIFVRGLTSYLFHDENKRLDHARIQVNGGVGNSIGPCGSVVGGGYFRRRNSIEDPELIVLVDNIQTTRSVNLGISCVRAPSLQVLARGERLWTSNSLELAANGDSTTDVIAVGITYSRSNAGSISLSGNYSRTDYEDRPINNGSPDGFETVAGGVRLERRLGGRIQAVASLSYTETQVDSAPLTLPPGSPGTPTLPDEFSGLTYSGEVSYRASSRLTGRVRFAREVAPSLIPGATFELRTSALGHVDYRIGSRFTFGAGAEYRENDLRGQFVLLGTQITDAITRVYDVSIRYRQNKRISLVLRGAREERDAKQTQFDYVSKRIGLGLEVSY